MTLMLLVILTAVLAVNFEPATSEHLEICHGEDMYLECPLYETLLISSAEYGRMEFGRCITVANDLMGCTNDVFPQLDMWCSGRQECSIRVSNTELEDSNANCIADLTKYLDVIYTCVPVVSECDANKPNKLSATHGLISSEMMKEGGCGTLRSPWIISAGPGQSVSISLIDFSVDEETKGFVTCRHVYGYILERLLGINHTICGGKQREGALYDSDTHNVEIVTNSAQLVNHTFLIRFEVNGCADLIPPTNVWYKRTGNEAVIGCEIDHQEWQLTCSGNTWHGTVGNCSAKPELSKDTGPAEQDQSKLSVSVALLAAITGGVFVLDVVAIVGVVYIKKIADGA